MNTNVLIEALVRQTTVLLATLATATGQRTPLARVANQVFADLVAELKAQGLGNKVIADMFGMALRTYQYRMARLAESATDQGRSLWEAILSFIRESGSVRRAEVLARFRRDDPELVSGVLRDLVESRLLYRTGRGDQTSYRVALEEFERPSDDRGALAQLILVELHRHGPIAKDELSRHVPLPDPLLCELLASLVAEGRVRASEHAGATRYEHDSILIGYGNQEGWQAALFDHYQAMVAAISTKLRRGRTQADASDAIGGSTYHFDIWPGHPFEHEVIGLLAELRARSLALCERVQAHNAAVGPLPAQARRVISYVGQTVRDEREEDEERDA
jgi:hypothetical protein